MRRQKAGFVFDVVVVSSSSRRRVAGRFVGVRRLRGIKVKRSTSQPSDRRCDGGVGGLGWASGGRCEGRCDVLLIAKLVAAWFDEESRRVVKEEEEAGQVDREMSCPAGWLR